MKEGFTMTEIAKIIGGAPVTDGHTADAKDNLYMYVNADWLKKTKVPSDKPAAGTFQDMDEKVHQQLMDDFDAYHQGTLSDTNAFFNEAMKMHALALDFNRRKIEGVKPLTYAIRHIQSLFELKELQESSAWILEGLPLPFTISIEPDWKDTSKEAVFLYAPDLILPDKTYYTGDSKKKDTLLKTWKEMSRQLLEIIGYSNEEACHIVEEAIQFDASLVPYVMTAEEFADVTKIYHPVDFDQLQFGQSFDFKSTIQHLVHTKPNKVIVTQPKFFEALDQIVNVHTFSQLKSWILTKAVNAYAPYLEEDIRQLADEFHRALSGIDETISQRKFAYAVVDDTFKYVIGDYYGKKYFGQQAKDDATKMIQEMINIYKNRLQHNTWLGEATKQKAITKLNHIKIKVGFPDKIKPVYQKLKINPKETLLENYIRIQQTMIEDEFGKFTKPVDRSEWDMPSQLVNACYDPSRNDITFPAAILEAPFYSLKQSRSQNFGGIGCVMGHEISHAFDNNGSHFDEYGNMVNWWTEDDEQHFKSLTQKMIDEFNGIPFAGSHVDGKLVVSENIADNGGMSCAIEAMHQHQDDDFTAFFENWARIWRMKASKSYQQMLLATDVHAPQELRANVQPQNFDEFYQAFQVTDKDGMWLDPEKRVQIW